MSITNVERRALQRIRHHRSEAKQRQNNNDQEGSVSGRERAEPESKPVRWTPEQIANFVRRIGPIPVSRDKT